MSTPDDARASATSRGARTETAASWLLPISLALRASSSAFVTTSRTAIAASHAGISPFASSGPIGGRYQSSSAAKRWPQRIDAGR